MGSFVESQLLQTPRWLGGVAGDGYQKAQAEIRDTELVLCKVALKARWPYPIGPIDAVSWQGADRLILPAPSEADDAYALRLTNAHEFWYWGGTKAGLAAVFDPLAPSGFATPPIGGVLRLDGVTNAALVGERLSLDNPTPYLIPTHAAPTSIFAFFYDNYEWGGFWFGVDWYSLVYGLIDSSGSDPWDTDAGWDDPGDWDDGGLWDTTMTMAEAKYIRSMLRRVKDVGSYPVTLALMLPGAPGDGFWNDGAIWDDPGDWQDAGAWAPIYLTIGHVWGEEEWLGDGLVDCWDDPGTWTAFVDPLAVEEAP